MLPVIGTKPLAENSKEKLSFAQRVTGTPETEIVWAYDFPPEMRSRLARKNIIYMLSFFIIVVT